MLVGQEYTVIGWCKNRLILRDKIMLQNLLEEVCFVIDMTSLGSIGVNVPIELDKLNKDKFEDEGGSTSCVLAGRVDANQASLVLSTSHANIHGWPDRDVNRDDGGFFWFTVGSCRPFKTMKVDNWLHEYLKATHVKRISRWIEYKDGVFMHSEQGLPSGIGVSSEQGFIG